MTRESILIALGVIVAVTPYLGLPLSILSIVLPVLGLITAFIGFTLRARHSSVSVRPPQSSERVVPVYEAPEA